MRLTVVIVAVFGVLALAGEARAYPQFQLSTGADTCRQCHFSPAGGGLINEYGRDEASTISQFEAGDGRFLHGAWTPPASFQIGGDYRGAFGVKSDKLDGPPAGPGGWDSEALAFPMQADLYLRPAIGPVSLNLTLGLRGSARGDNAVVDRLASREHYLMYERDTWYVRAGRFFPIYGIRTQDHTAFVRRDLQMYIYEEPYAVGFGNYGDASELHVSAFVRQPVGLLGTARDSGVAAYWETRNDESTAAYAAQTRMTVSETDARAWVGGVYKRWMEAPKLMLLAELDLGLQLPSGPGAGSAAADPDALVQVVGYAGATYMALPGWMIGGAVHFSDPDLLLHDNTREALEANVQWFPIPHLELHLLTRVLTTGLDVGDPDLLALLQLHYYL